MTGSRGPLSSATRGVPARRPRAGVVAELVPRAATPDAPPGLGAAGRAAWSAAFASAGWLASDADLALVEIYASLFDRRAQLLALLGEGGPLARGSAGQSVEAPCSAALRRVEAEILTYAGTLGLTPATRLRHGYRPAERPRRAEPLSPEERDRALRALGRST